MGGEEGESGEEDKGGLVRRVEQSLALVRAGRIAERYGLPQTMEEVQEASLDAAAAKPFLRRLLPKP